MSKSIYRWDEQGRFSSSNVVPDDYQLKANETFQEPTNGLTPIVHTNAGWRGATEEEHEAYEQKKLEELYKEHPEVKPHPTEPNAQDQALNALGLQLANVEKQQATLAQAVNALGLQQAAANQKKNAQ